MYCADRQDFNFSPQTVVTFKEDAYIAQSKPRTNVPRGRSGHRVVADDVFLYSFGGYNPDALPHVSHANENNSLFKEVWRLNIATRIWHLLEIPQNSFPNELASTTVELFGNNMIVHGGTGVPFGVKSSNDTHVFNLKCKSAIKVLKTKGVPPPAKYGQGIVLDKESKKLYIVGGTSGTDFFMDIHELNVRTMKWRQLPVANGPDPRYRHEIALHNSCILVFGGGTLQNTFGFRMLPMFDLKKEKWDHFPTEQHSFERQGPSFPPHRRCHGGVMVPGGEGRDPEYIICGGFTGRVGLKDIWSLNLRTKKWYKWNSELPHPLYFHDIALTPQGKLFIFGGITLGEQRYSRRTSEVLSCWAYIPKLSEISWEALLYYVPHLHNKSCMELLKCGIPRRFIDRIYTDADR